MARRKVQAPVVQDWTYWAYKVLDYLLVGVAFSIAGFVAGDFTARQDREEETNWTYVTPLAIDAFWKADLHTNRLTNIGSVVNSLPGDNYLNAHSEGTYIGPASGTHVQ